ATLYFPPRLDMHTSAKPALAEYQKAMLDLLKERVAVPFSDPHLAEVVHSPGLGLLREVAVWWRGFAVRARALGPRGCSRNWASTNPAWRRFTAARTSRPTWKRRARSFSSA